MNIDLSTLNLSEEATALAALWKSLPRKQGNHCPEKSSFSPVSLRQHLRSIFMFERCDEETLLVRVAGSYIREKLGQEITGHNLFDIVPSEYKYSYRTYYNKLQSDPCAGVVKRPAARPSGGHHLLNTILLPLLDIDGVARFFVGALKVESLPIQLDEIRKGFTQPQQNLEMFHINLSAASTH